MNRRDLMAGMMATAALPVAAKFVPAAAGVTTLEYPFMRAPDYVMAMSNPTTGETLHMAGFDGVYYVLKSGVIQTMKSHVEPGSAWQSWRLVSAVEADSAPELRDEIVASTRRDIAEHIATNYPYFAPERHFDADA